MATKRRPLHLVGATHFRIPESGRLEIGYRTSLHGQDAINQLTAMALDRITSKKLTDRQAEALLKRHLRITGIGSPRAELEGNPRRASTLVFTASTEKGRRFLSQIVRQIGNYRIPKRETQ